MNRLPAAKKDRKRAEEGRGEVNECTRPLLTVIEMDGGADANLLL